MKKIVTVLGLSIVIVTLLAASCSRSSGVSPVVDECYRVYLKSGASIEGLAVQRPKDISPLGKGGAFVLVTRDGVVTIPNDTGNVAAIAKIECSSLGYER